MADEKSTLGIALAMETLKQGASRSAEEAYKALAVQSPVERPPWELLDQGQKICPPRPDRLFPRRTLYWNIENTGPMRGIFLRPVEELVESALVGCCAVR
jgi:hypothetical protein